MPKLARNDWEEKYYYDSEIASLYNRRSSYYTSEVPKTNYENLRELNRPNTKTKRKYNRKKALFRFIFTILVMSFFAFLVLPFGYKNITLSIFNPNPYKNLKTDISKFAFPLNNYLSNSNFLGAHFISYSANDKKAQMISIKESVNMPLLKSKLEDLGKIYRTISPSVYVWDYETGNYVDINASKIYPTASIIKIPVLIDVFKSIEANQFSLDDTMNLTEYYRTEGSGGIQFNAANTEYTIDELAKRMITESDNSATNMLIAKVGAMDEVNHAIRSWGLTNTAVETWLPDYKGTNHTTAKDMARMLYNIDENSKFLSPVSRLKILDYMGHVHNNRLIHAGLGQGAVFLHKTGDIGQMLGDAGIVITPNGKKYIVVIMVKRPHNSIAGKEYIVKASEIIYNYMVK